MDNNIDRSRVRIYVFLSFSIILLIFILLRATQTYFHIDDRAYIRQTELQENLNISTNKTALEKNPRIIHQTWKDANIPTQWQQSRNYFIQMHQDYKYMLWTDVDSRQFIMDNYKWFLPTFDSYSFNIQRADAIRYFVLHKYGGIYMDLDVGCLRKLDSLLQFELILPETVPVGVSNDIMASTEKHPFMDYLIHNLNNLNFNYLAHYPTVMFSTGPMFVTLSYMSFKERLISDINEIRILPKHLYGKNIDPSESEGSFFRHFYGSSWHASDATSFIFLRDYGRILLAFVLMALSLYVFISNFRRSLLMIDRQLKQRGYIGLSNLDGSSQSEQNFRNLGRFLREQVFYHKTSFADAFRRTTSIFWRKMHWIDLTFRDEETRRRIWKPLWFEKYKPFLLWVFVTLCSTFILILFHKEIFQELEQISLYLRELGPIGVLAFGLFILITTIPPLPLYSTSIVLCGYTFGMLKGFAIAYIAALSGAILVFMISRSYFRIHLDRTIKRNEEFAKLIQVVERRPRLLFLIRLAPYPYNLLNASLASSQKLTLKTFAFCTALSLPKLMIHCALGSSTKDFAAYGGIGLSQTKGLDKGNEINFIGSIKAIYIIFGISFYLGLSIYLVQKVRKTINKELEEELADRRNNSFDEEYHIYSE